MEIPCINKVILSYLTYSSCAGDKGQSSVKKCTIVLRNLSENLGGKFPSPTLGFPVVGISCLDDAFSVILNWTSAINQVEG